MRFYTPLRKQVTPLLRESKVRRKLPVNFKPGDLPLFNHELEKIIPQTRLLEFRDVWASADGFLFKGGRILEESFAFPLHFEEWKKRRVFKFFASNYLLKKRRRFERDAIWVVDDWSYGYFHWLADALTRLFTVKDRLSDLVLLLPHRYKALEFVRP